MAGPIFASLVLAILALVLFAWIAQEVDGGGSENFDSNVRQIVHSTASPWLTGSMEVITRLGSWNVIVLGIAVCEIAFVRIKWWRAAVWLLVGMVGASILDTALKTAFHRTRPSIFFGALPKSYSFPSGHALISFCFYGIVAALVTARLRNRAVRVATWISAALIVLAIGFSRIYLGVHYPTDVVAGYCAATFWIGALVSADRFWQPMRTRHPPSVT